MFYVILGVLSSKKKIRIDDFKSYCYAAAKLYVRNYDWYYMPPSVHVILMHGYLVINEFKLPIGMYSEEAQESYNKIIKQFRGNFSRRTSRY